MLKMFLFYLWFVFYICLLCTCFTKSSQAKLISISNSNSQILENPTNHHHRITSRAATSRKELLWDHGIVPYRIESRFSAAHRALFKRAMRHWEHHTCIRFVERTPEHRNYIVFTERFGGGCYSNVGKLGVGPQWISIGKNCDQFGIVVHELGHVIGFSHEHTRPDRDEHVRIIEENILDDQVKNFAKLSDEEVNSHGQPYDHDSIMHYSRNTFVKNPQLDTIEALEDPVTRIRPQIGQRLGLSKGDIAQANLLYNCPVCGRTIQDANGKIHSPNYQILKDKTSKESQNSNCEWRLTATDGERIVLQIGEIDIPESNGCEKGFLEVRDGYWFKSKLLGSFCGEGEIPFPIISTGPRLLITYVLNPLPNQILRQNSNLNLNQNQNQNQRIYRGFNATYQVICGGEIEAEKGILQSPNYPDEYRPNQNCVWKIISPKSNHQIVLQFQTFEIENSDNCQYDFLEIRDGYTENSSLIRKLCGHELPEQIHSSGNSLYLKFSSDNSGNKAGFSATFTSDFNECSTKSYDHGCEHECVNLFGGYRCECKSGFNLDMDGKKCIAHEHTKDACALNNHQCEQICRNSGSGSYFCECENGFTLHENGHDCVEGSCSHLITSSFAEVSSPNFPGNYTNNLDCFWYFTAIPGHRIQLRFVEFDLEYSQECTRDFVTILDSGSNLEQLGRFCGSRLPYTITSSMNRASMHFKTDSSIQAKGFKAHYSTICGGRLVANGSLEHLYSHAKYGEENYEGGLNCEWKIETKEKNWKIYLKFFMFELEHSKGCSGDYVEIFDGYNYANSLGRFCGNKVPEGVISNGDFVLVRFRTDESIHSKGFTLSYLAVENKIL